MLFHLRMLVLVASPTCPDQRSNLHPWHLGVTLSPPELPGQSQPTFLHPSLQSEPLSMLHALSATLLFTQTPPPKMSTFTLVILHWRSVAQVPLQLGSYPPVILPAASVKALCASWCPRFTLRVNLSLLDCGPCFGCIDIGPGPGDA